MDRGQFFKEALEKIKRKDAIIVRLKKLYEKVIKES